MGDNEVTGATARPWSYNIQHGPNGEEIYAWVYYHDLMVCIVKVHHAKMIVEAVNAHDRLTTENAELRRERDEYKRSGRIAIDAGEQLIGLLTGERDAAEARAPALDREAVARVLCQSGKFETGQGTCAVLCMDQLGDVRKKGCGHCSRVHGKLADAILSLLRTALAAVVMDEKR